MAGAGLVLGSSLVRVMAERWVHGQRRRGRGLQRVLVMGHPEPTARLIETVDAAPGSGLVIVGAALPFDGYPHTPSLGVPVVLDEIEVAALVEMAAELSVDAVALSSDPDVSGLGGRRLHDGLADRGIALLAARSTAGAAWSPCLEDIPGTPLVRVGARAVGWARAQRRAMQRSRGVPDAAVPSSGVPSLAPCEGASWLRRTILFDPHPEDDPCLETGRPPPARRTPRERRGPRDRVPS